MLWSLLNAFELHVRETDADSTTLTATRATLILEPHGGGGDLVRQEARGRRVQQIKSRSDGGT